MKFTPEEHLKFARSALRAAEAATKAKQARLVSLAHAHQILATPRWQNGKRTVTDANAGLDDLPRFVDSKNIWDQHLAKLQSLPPSKSRSKVIQLAKALIAEMPTKQELPLMTHWLPEPPGIFGDTLSLWEQRLIELRSLPNSVNTQAAIENAKQMIAMKKAED